MSNSSNWRSARSQGDDNPHRPSSAWRSGEQRNPGPGRARTRPYDVNVHRTGRQQDDSASAQAIAEGRRIYLGNLLYSVTPEDVERLLQDNNLMGPDYKETHISVDPFNGRNPGYCFIEFRTKEAADATMAGLEGAELFGRPVKCRPCLPKGAVRSVDSDGTRSRWGNFSEGANSSLPSKTYYERSNAQNEGRQVHVGGLPRMLDQGENQVEMRDIFHGFEVVAISKRISPRTPHAPGEDDRRNFCFVDFPSVEQAQAAVKAVDGSEYRGAIIKAAIAVPRSRR